jgi:hypothetical protein
MEELAAFYKEHKDFFLLALEPVQKKLPFLEGTE